jgi:hypothetical protein
MNSAVCWLLTSVAQAYFTDMPRICSARPPVRRAGAAAPMIRHIESDDR